MTGIFRMATRGSILLRLGVSTSCQRSMWRSCVGHCESWVGTLLHGEYVGSLILTEVTLIHAEQTVPVRNVKYILY